MREQLAAAQPELLGAVQVLEHLLLAGLRAIVLIGQHRRGRARLAGVEQQQLVSQSPQHAGVELERLDVDGAVGMERVGADAAVGGHVGILLADRLAEHLYLDLARRLGQIPGVIEVRRAWARPLSRQTV